MSLDFPTRQLREAAERAEDIGDLQALLRCYDGSFTNWQRQFSQLMEESGRGYSQVAELSGIHRNTLRRWCNGSGAPRSRNIYVRLGFGLALSPAQTDTLLIRYGGYPALYARDLFDAICIFLLEQGQHSYDEAEALYDQWLDVSGEGSAYLDTVYAAAQLRQLTTAGDFQHFVLSHGALFRQPHLKLREYLALRLQALGYDPVAEKSASVHRLFQDQQIPSRFEKDVSLLMTRGLVPRRERLLALAVALGLTAEDIDEMLALAGMEPLCAKNRLECILIYALQQLSLAHPELAVQQTVQLLAVANQPRLQAQCRQLLQDYSAACYQSDPSAAESVSAYLRDIVEHMTPEEAAELLPLI